jgi:hypothetical protein
MSMGVTTKKDIDVKAFPRGAKTGAAPASVRRAKRCEKRKGGESMEPGTEETDLRKAEELQSRASRCDTRMKSLIDEMSACIRKNGDLSETLKTRGAWRRLSDALTGKNRAIRSEIKKNAMLIDTCVSEALLEIVERDRINKEGMEFINRGMDEMHTAAEEYAAECAAFLHAFALLSRSLDAKALPGFPPEPQPAKLH